jgi:hypothetical protein
MGREIESHLGIVWKFLFLIMFWSLGNKTPKNGENSPNLVSLEASKPPCYVQSKFSTNLPKLYTCMFFTYRQVNVNIEESFVTGR